MDLSTALAIDLLTLMCCGGLVLTKGGAGHSHPAVIYMVFHALVVTNRIYAIQRGAPTFLSGIPGYDGVSSTEIARAVLYADFALVAATLGWMSARKRRRERRRLDIADSPLAEVPSWRLLRLKPLRIVAVITLPLGTLALVRFGFLPGFGAPNSSSTSSYLTIALTWPGLILVAFIYYRGFKFTLLVPLGIYLCIIALQGYGRFRLVVPVILLAQIYLDRRKRRWPDLRVAVILALGLLLFFPLKQIGRSVQSSDDVGAIRSSAQASISEALAGRAGDQVILDQLAMTLSLTDDSGRIFAGRPYLNVLTLPVPREVWAGKPGLADHLSVISTPSRPLEKLGSVTTLPGDLYLNFRLPGLLLFMFLLARWSARLYEAAYRRPYRSIERFAFLLLSCNLIQIYRDGLISVPVFLLVQMLPLIILLILHLRYRGDRMFDPNQSTDTQRPKHTWASPPRRTLSTLRRRTLSTLR